VKKFPDDSSIKQGFISGEDTTCAVYCECAASMEESLWVSNYEIVRCPKCGRGYKTEFVVWQYEPGETDP
jgi:hypothetical protein